MINEMPIMSSRCVYDSLSPGAPAVFNVSFKNKFDSSLNDSINSNDIMEYSERSLPLDNSIHLAQTPCRDRRHSQLWDSGLGSPTPGSSPVKPSRFSERFNLRHSPSLSPIPFTFYENEENIMECSLTDVSNQNNSHNEFGISLLPQTPVSQNYSMHSNRRIQFSQSKAASNKLQRSLKKMKLSTSPPSTNSSLNKNTKQSKPRPLTKMRSRPKVLFNSSSPQANVNPFVSFGSASKPLKSGIKRCRDQSDSSFCLDSSLEEQHPNKKISLKEMNVCRFREEFHVLRRIGDGQFGSVYKCVNRLDGCIYAIKRSQRPVAGNVLETNAVNEVYAHAVLGKHQHIIGYFSSWVELDRVFIQTEYCNGGNLNNIITKNRYHSRVFSEDELSILLSQLADGLSFIHLQNLVHLDLKPDNILICYKKQVEGVHCNMDEEDYTYQEIVSQLNTTDITYKIGDFGMVTSSINPTFNEGDCRYLPKEILQENTTDIQKADIFSLSLTVYEAGNGVCMPPNGPVWQEYRVMGLPDLKGVCEGFNELLKQMSACEPILRPTAFEVVRAVASFSKVQCINNQLSKELMEQKKENEKLKRQLQALLSQQGTRYVGKTCHKSQTLS